MTALGQTLQELWIRFAASLEGFPEEIDGVFCEIDAAGGVTLGGFARAQDQGPPAPPPSGIEVSAFAAPSLDGEVSPDSLLQELQHAYAALADHPAVAVVRRRGIKSIRAFSADESPRELFL